MTATPHRRPRAAVKTALTLVLLLVLAACGGAEEVSTDTAVEAEPAVASEEAPADTPVTEEDAGTETTGELTPVNLSFEWTCEGNWTIAYLGQQQGLFEEHGIDLSFERGQGGSTTTPLLAQGEFDVAVLSAPPVVLGAGQGLPITVIGVAASQSPVAILASPDVTSPEDLEGASVAVQTDQFEGAVWEAFLTATGIDAGSVEVIPSDDAAQAQFIAGDIDAIVTFYPTPSTIGLLEGREGDETVIRMQDHVPTYGHTIVANNGWLDAHGEDALAFQTAWAEATAYAIDNPDAALESLTSNCPELDAAAAEFTLDAYLEEYASAFATENGYLAFEPEGLVGTKDLLVDGGLMEDVDLEGFMTLEYLPDPPVTS